MTDFFRFPQTAHLAWLGQGAPRDDKLLAADEMEALLSHRVVIEEKLDGANIGISIGPDGQLRVQNRGQYLQAPYRGQFSRLNAWLGQHQYALQGLLTDETILFGEWCAAVHSVAYDNLPDWFLLFDLYDRQEQRFASVARRDALASTAGLATAPRIREDIFSLEGLMELLDDRRSEYADTPVEGLVVRKDAGEWCAARGKLVRADFTQAIETHWSRKPLRWNRVASSRED